ncbi:MAG: hypothetical protein QOD04_4283, partial [Pseudonocardiales bacterium]|nr:hypothetical protein [Pseudonocardiales bacterium]
MDGGCEGASVAGVDRSGRNLLDLPVVATATVVAAVVILVVTVALFAFVITVVIPVVT